MNINKICQILDLIREDFLKGSQYFSILLAWLQQRNGNIPSSNNWFNLYLKIFHSRRIYRLLQSIHYGPQIIKLIKQLKTQITFTTIFGLLGNFFISLFLLFDNVTIVLMMIKNSQYRTIRRVSYTIFLIGIIWQIISIAIRLRKSFADELLLKKQLEQMTPTEFLEKLNQIDESRKVIAIEFIHMLGDFIPTLARTNLPEIIIKTKVNKGTVGFFGIIASLSGILLKIKRMQKEGKQRME